MRRTRAISLGAGWLLLLAPALRAGPYSTAEANTNGNVPDAGIAAYLGPAGDGIAADESNGNYLNPAFVAWATKVINYSPAPGVGVAFRDPTYALGPATGDQFSAVSLGEVPSSTGTRPPPGTITLGFDKPLYNGAGADFAVFENGFLSQGEAGVEGQIFGELGYVEVSTDGTHFARFPSISLTPASVGVYGTVDSTNLYNLVGKHVNADGESWGTPFDLADLLNDALVRSGTVNLFDIRYVRIVDIPGDGTWLDSQGRSIYDSFPTLSSGGVDLEALGVLHQLEVPEPASAVLLFFGLPFLLTRPARS